MSDVLIIGAGFAGLTAAWQAAKLGHKVHVVAKGWGATNWLSGCIDVLGYYPIDSMEPVTSPADGVAALIADSSQHPYAFAGPEMIEASIAELQTLCQQAGYPLHGDLNNNWLLPSGVGTARPTCLAPGTMIAGDLNNKEPMLIVGFKQLHDFYPAVIADNLALQDLAATHTTVDMPSLQERHSTTPAVLALLMEQESFQAELAGLLSSSLDNAARVGFPAVLGQKANLNVHKALEQRLQRPVFEIPALTPSVPGMRLQQILVEAIRNLGGRVTPGIEILGAKTDGETVTAVFSETPGRQVLHTGDHYVLASGGILGGGITTDYSGDVREVIFDLPLSVPDNHTEWFQLDFLDRRGHPIYRSGVIVDEAFRPINGSQKPLYQNLSCAGSTLAHAEVVRERSFEGVAIATGYAAAHRL